MTEKKEEALGYIEKVMALSTGHMPSSKPDFSQLRIVEHKYGLIVFVSGTPVEEAVPEWLRLIYAAAIEQECTLIMFDRDCNEEPAFTIYDWWTR